MLLGDWAPRVLDIFTGKQQLNSFFPTYPHWVVSALCNCSRNLLAQAARPFFLSSRRLRKGCMFSPVKVKL